MSSSTTSEGSNKKRRFLTAEKKFQIYLETQNNDQPVGEILRREGLYSTDLARIRSQVKKGALQRGHQQAGFAHIGRGHPTDQRNQQHLRAVNREPQSKRVFLVADKPAALTGLERAPAQSGVRCRIGTGGLFLKPQQAAGRSVASMSAMAGRLQSKLSSKGASNTSLTRRNPVAPTCRRNSCIMRTSGIRWRLGR